RGTRGGLQPDGSPALHAHALDIERDLALRTEIATELRPIVRIRAQPVVHVNRGDPASIDTRVARNYIEEDDGIEATREADANRRAVADDSSQAFFDKSVEVHGSLPGLLSGSLLSAIRSPQQVEDPRSRPAA